MISFDWRITNLLYIQQTEGRVCSGQLKRAKCSCFLESDMFRNLETDGDQVPTKYLFVSTHCIYVDNVHAAICSRTISLAIATRWCCWHGKTEIFTSPDTGLTRNSLRPAHRVRCYPGPVLSGRTFLSRTGMVCTYEVWVIGGILGMSCPWLN